MRPRTVTVTRNPSPGLQQVQNHELLYNNNRTTVLLLYIIIILYRSTLTLRLKEEYNYSYCYSYRRLCGMWGYATGDSSYIFTVFGRTCPTRWLLGGLPRPLVKVC
jgi:hypothetical protein